MCGIATFFARESIPSFDVIDILLKDTELRGTDGFGIVLIQRKLKSYKTFYTTKRYSDEIDTVKELYSKMNIGDVLIALSRATPETEEPSSSTNMQPIVNGDCVVAHNGDITHQIYKELVNYFKESNEFEFITKIDSESIIASYIKHKRNMKDAIEYIAGGIACVLYDFKKDRLYTILDFKPIAHSYIRGIGYFLSSNNNTLEKILSITSNIKRDAMNVWEDWYHHYLDGHHIYEVDLDSGMTRIENYTPRYITQTFDSYKTKCTLNDKELCLVSTSGGLDSTTTLAMLKLAGYENIIACHFKYGHRGQDAEELAIKNVTSKLNIPLKIFDLENIVKSIDSTSMLIDDKAEITTGTDEGLKRLDAWVCGRNMIFLTIMASLAESECMKHKYNTINLLGGFLNLSESGCYPDNSEYFIQSFLNHVKYSTLVGCKFNALYGLADLMKSDLFELIKSFNLFDIYSDTISCDRPIVIDGVPHNCSKNGMPACGSGLLSYWASKMNGLDDMKIRKFYEVDNNFEAYVPGHISQNNISDKSIYDIIDRIHFPKERLNILRNIIKGK